MEIFRILMQTRRDRLAYNHVGALNIVELEFYKVKTVMSSYKTYVEHLYLKEPSEEEERAIFGSTRDDFFAQLLKDIGNQLGYNFDKSDLKKQSYFPIGWESNNRLSQENQQLLNDVLAGRQPLVVATDNSTKEMVENVPTKTVDFS